MDFSQNPNFALPLSEPRFIEDAGELNSALRQYDRTSLGKLMKVSEKIADETVSSIVQFREDDAPSGAALYSYSGTVFKHLDVSTLTEDQLEFAGEHIVILSGLYGVLEPLDEIHPYRLEMKTALPNSAGENLYKFWRDKITSAVVERDEPILNLASNEYSKAINFKEISKDVITVQFKERSGEKLRTVGMYSKMARGMLAGRLIREKVTDPENMKEWDIGGYTFDKDISTAFNWTFSGNWRG